MKKAHFFLNGYIHKVRVICKYNFNFLNTKQNGLLQLLFTVIIISKLMIESDLIKELNWKKMMLLFFIHLF